MNVYGVIMAGGSGTRFWPLSRLDTPKQLLDLSGNGPMLNETIKRLTHVVNASDIFVVTNRNQAQRTRAAVNDLIDCRNVLAEPMSRNTAACIGYAAMRIVKTKGDGVMVVVPADHHIADVPSLVALLQLGIMYAEREDRLLTIGFSPTFASTGYGYIRYEKSCCGAAKPVLEFREKPDLNTAENFVRSGEYVWNSGMFVWKASLILRMLEKYAPDVYEVLLRIGEHIGCPDEQSLLEAVYNDIRSVSIDYAVMEPAAKEGGVLVIPGECGWSDVGSWDMMSKLHDADPSGNSFVGDVVALNTQDCVAYSTGRTIALMGVDDVVVVETPDAVMVCRKDHAQDVRQIVESLEVAGRVDLL